MIHKFKDRDSLHAYAKEHKVEKNIYCREGPIHKHAGVEYVQIYLGQHEWLSIRVDDPTEFRLDPGWVGTSFGFGLVDEEDFPKDAWGSAETICAPEREGKPITCDGLLFGNEQKLRDYLGPDDPLL